MRINPTLSAVNKKPALCRFFNLIDSGDHDEESSWVVEMQTLSLVDTQGLDIQEEYNAVVNVFSEEYHRAVQQ